mgnify:CR=1 FL=1
MASSWLDSWGQSWGDAWGPVVQVPGAMRGQAHGTSSALGILTVSGIEIPEISYGGAVPRRTDDPQRRRKRDDETLLMIGAL